MKLWLSASGLSLLSLAGCAGVYAEVAATTLPSATVPSGSGMTTSSSASTIGFNVGADFGSSSKRFAVGYQSDSISLQGGSAKLGSADMRFDFNVLSLNDRAKIRLGLGVDFGSGSSTFGGMTTKGDGGGAYGGLDVTYFLTWHIGLHAFAGARYLTEQVTGGTFSGSGATFRLTATYQFGDVRPDYDVVVPLDSSTDITGLIENGARGAGCTTFRMSRPGSGYAFVEVHCGESHLSYFQIAEGISITCHHMSKPECERTNHEILSSKAIAPPPAVPATAPTPAPAAPATPATPPPAATPTPPDASAPPAPEAAGTGSGSGSGTP